MAFSKLKKLPKNLSVGGYLNISNTEVEILPENLSIKGNLNIESTNIKMLPEKISLGGKLYLNINKIQNICYFEDHENSLQKICVCWINNKLIIISKDFLGNLEEFLQLIAKDHSAERVEKYKYSVIQCIKNLSEKLTENLLKNILISYINNFNDIYSVKL